MRCDNILEAIGRTPLIRLNRLGRDLPPPIYVKADHLNPGASVKDRIAITIVEDAERRGLLKPGGTIVENTSGNTGMGLAMVAAVKGYKAIFTITDKQSKEKIDALKALGAQVIVCPTAVEPEDPRSYYSVARKLAQEIPNAFFANQYENPMNPEAHYRTTGPEIWEDTEGKITHFVAGIGTCGTIVGVGRFLKEKNPGIQIVGADPIGSVFYEYKKTGKLGKHDIYVVEGIGQEMMPAVADFTVIDDVIQVSDKDCFNLTRKLALLEGIFAGGSAGAAIYAALEVARRGTKEDLIVAFLPDSGARYLSKVYNDEWMRDNQYLEPEVRLTAEEILRAKHGSGPMRELVIARPHETMLEALLRMQENDISQLPVMENGTPIGAVYEDEILRLVMSGKDLRDLIVREVMGKSFPVVPRNARLEEITRCLTPQTPAVFVDLGSGRYDVLTKYDLVHSLRRTLE